MFIAVADTPKPAGLDVGGVGAAHWSGTLSWAIEKKLFSPSWVPLMVVHKGSRREQRNNNNVTTNSG